MLCGQLNFAEGRDLLHHLHLLLAAEILEGVLHDPGGAHVLDVAKGVIVQVRERQPVARARWGNQLGWVDVQGNWLSPDPYRSPKSWPELELLGWENHTPDQWALLLKALQQSEIQIRAVDWQSGAGITLHTELGNVYLGPISDRLPLQIQTLNQMRDLRRYCECTPDDIVQIDLTSPSVPTLQLTPTATQERWKDVRMP